MTSPKRARFRKLARLSLIGVACLLVVYLVLVLAGGGLSPRFNDTFAWHSDSPLLFSHRGLGLNVPENSDASLVEAQRLGFLAVEIDVRKTKSGELVLFHDKSARRTLGLDEEFRNLTWDQVRGCKLLLKGKATTNTVPTLREVFQKFGQTLKFYLDMKNRGFHDADQIVALINEFGLYDRTILASVDPLFIAYVEHQYPKVNTALERFDFFQVWLYRLIPKKWKPDYLSGPARKVTPGHVEWLRKQRLLSKRIVYEVDATNYERMLNFGITKALVDYDPSVHSRTLSQPIAASNPKAQAVSPSNAAKAAGRKQLASDTSLATPAGATFIAPAGWWVETFTNGIVLTPEGDSRIALVDVQQQDPDSAVKSAWAESRLDLKWALKLATDAPGREGWDSLRNYDYEVSPNERRVVGAQAAKRGDAFTVVVFNLNLAVAEKRGGQIATIFDRLQPPGFRRESFAGKKPRPLDAERLAKVKDFIEKARAALQVPGVAISLYQEGRVVFEGGFGVRELGKPAPVDAETLFMVASNTKSMTTLLLATLVDEGKLTWDTPVIAVMPNFKLGDPETTKQVLIKHLVCACTGLPRQDFEWLFQFEKATAASEMALLATFQPTSKFGELFQYSNLLAAAGGFVAAYIIFPGRELGAAYDNAMAQRVFSPIGMTSTTFDFPKALAGNHASPHAWNVDGVTAPAEMGINYAVIPLRPAGGAWSNAKDMMRYLRMELGKGVLPNGKHVVTEANVVKRREQQIKIGNDLSYGMGLEVDRKWGIPVVHHGGSLIGYKSDMFYLPEHDVAAVILVNSDEGGSMLSPFGRRLLEVLFDGKSEAEEDIAVAARNLKAAVAKERSRLRIPADRDVADKLAPRYTNDSLGEITVLRTGAETRFDFGEWKSAMASRRNDDGTTAFVTIVPGFTGVSFVIGDKDGRRTLTFRDAQHEYVFTETK